MVKAPKWTPKEPATNIPLAAKKNLRDEYESKIDDLKERLQKCLHQDWNFSVDPLKLYPYVEEKRYQLGYCIHEYYDNAIRALERLTDDGKDVESAAAINKYAPKKIITIEPGLDFNYCGMDVHDEHIRIIFHPEKVLTNCSDVGEKFAQKLDIAMDNAGELPLTTQKAYKERTEEGVEKFQEDMEKLFGVRYQAKFDIASILAEMKKLHLEKDGTDRFYSYWPQAVPRYVVEYFDALARRLKEDKFGTDDMLKEGFIETVDKKVVKFEIVDELWNDKNYNDLIFKDGMCILQTVPKYYMTNIYDVAENVESKL